MITKPYLRFFTNWSYYLTFLWLIAIAFAIYLVAAYVGISHSAKENPAAGLAMVGVVEYAAILVLFVGFIAVNYFVRKRVAGNDKLSNRFLATSWAAVAVSIIGIIAILVINWMNQSYYERNVAPKLDRCYQEYLTGNRSTPYDDCVESAR